MRHCYRCQANVTSISFCYIFTGLKVTITMETTIQTLKETRMPFGIQRITPIASLRGVSRIDINNPNSFSESFVFNKELQLPESPLVNPFIIFSCCSDANQIFHNNNISFIQYPIKDDENYYFTKVINYVLKKNNQGKTTLIEDISYRYKKNMYNLGFNIQEIKCQK